MRVLHIAETLKGGIATYLNTLCAIQIRSYGFDNLSVIAPEEHIKYLSDNLQRLTSGITAQSRLLRALMMSISALREVRRFRPDVVHIHSTYAGLFVRPALRIFYPKLQIVYCAHGWAWDQPKQAGFLYLVRLLEVSLSYLSNSVICISEHDYRSALRFGISSRRLFLVRNGLEDFPTYCSLATNNTHESKPIKVLFIGRLDHQKGADMLPEIANLLGAKYFIEVIGSPVLSKTPYLADLPLNMRLHGWKNSDQISHHLASADLVIIPSRWEGFGLVALEAMRSSVCVIASRVGGLAEVIEDKSTGLLVGLIGAKSFAEAIMSIDRKTMKTMGMRGRKRFLEKFEAQRMFAETDTVYRL